jgi:hypothetical protein
MDMKDVEGMSLSLGHTPTPDQSSTSWFLDPDTCIDDYIVGIVCCISEAGKQRGAKSCMFTVWK